MFCKAAGEKVLVSFSEEQPPITKTQAAAAKRLQRFFS